jgi:hypothetical protein
MSEQTKAWDGEMVRRWLESRFSASRADQDAADKRGRSHEDDYDKAAAEEWVCRAVMRGDATADQKQFAERLKALLDQEDYDRAGVHDQRRFEREVRSYLRKLMKMTKANAGFENMLRFQ